MSDNKLKLTTVVHLLKKKEGSKSWQQVPRMILVFCLPKGSYLMRTELFDKRGVPINYTTATNMITSSFSVRTEPT